ncbi:putative berberine/berberine, FAD-binding, type 2 [Rosa chinensis]|uniref:Putative berberine/berberine, FAD-binding, type 2 n=1 Tax=Rosa chinensis TaxID=74649 RepID=A0A2P6Q6J0_ROSCH|nr:putative berberine/berberine, FAD-binding, type 2 [Rosa chinensis]
MKIPCSTLVFTLSVLSLSISISCATSNPILNDFFQCLPKYSNSSYPISEAIFTRENTYFQSVLLSYIRNLRHCTPTTPKPLAIVTAKHESHVQATVMCAKQHGLHMRIRSGGHDYEGLSFISYISNTSYIVLDMFYLREIDVNIADESAWVGSGAIVGELYYSIAEKSKVHAFPGGVCPSVGVGGLFSGGGYGPTMRKFGLTVDNIVDARLVNVNGTILDRKSMGEDLFWAIRGGGGASFGVILSWKIKLLQVPPVVTVFRITKTLDQGAADVLHRLLRMSWIESTLFFSEYAFGTPIKALIKRPTEPPPFFFKGKSDYVKQPIPKEVLKSIFEKMINRYESTHMQWNPYGGRMNEISESETPFPHRAGNLFMIQYWTYWMEKGIESTNKYLNLSRNLYGSMTPYVSKSPREVLHNYRDLDIGSNMLNQTSIEHARVYGRTYFKGNFERLVRVKSAVDPQNFFKHEQSIPPL